MMDEVLCNNTCLEKDFKEPFLISISHKLKFLNLKIYGKLGGITDNTFLVYSYSL